MRAAEPITDTDADGWLRLRLRLDWPEEAAGVLLSGGPLVEVLAPLEIRAEVAAIARAVSARYDDDRGGGDSSALAVG